ncbi:caspase domain-containing protein [Desarmillaria ectypa]|nr:caspase domain-containing protein [Desarmillaria ectypa]
MGNKAKAKSNANATIRPTLVVLKGLQAAGELAPLPYIKGIAALAITVLEIIDNTSTNNRDIQGLAERIGDTVIAVKDAAVTYSRVGTGNGSAIEQVCTNFIRESSCLEDIIHDLREMERNNTSKSRITQFLTTSNVRDEINEFVRQIDNLQRNFDTKNILSICANNEVSDSYLRALEHGMTKLRAEHSNMHRTLAHLLVSHNELRTQVSNQGRFPESMNRNAKKDRGEATVIVQSTFDSRYMAYYLLLETLSATLFWTVSCFTNLLPTPSILYRQRARMQHYLSPSIPISTPGKFVQRFKHRHGPRRKALCIGINYFGQPCQLRGCINDAWKFREFLICYCGYKAWDIAMLTDDSPDPRQHATRKNIIDAMNWLANDAQPGDTLFFFYAGSGVQVCTEDGNRVDGYDIAILPVDYNQHGYILDQEIYQIIVKPLPPGCRLTALLPCCYSEAALDLPYVVRSAHFVRLVDVTDLHLLQYDCDTQLFSPRPSISSKSTAADVVIWSGCKETAIKETVIGGVAVSAFNYEFLSSLKINPKQSCRELLHSLSNLLAARDDGEKPQLATNSWHIVGITLHCLLFDLLLYGLHYQDPDLPATL